jgi:hypothetical protein
MPVPILVPVSDRIPIPGETAPAPLPRHPMLLPDPGTTGHRARSDGTLRVLVTDDVAYVQQRREGTTETYELGREDVQVAHGLELVRASAGHKED